MKNNLALTIVLSCLSAIDSEAKLALARSPLTIVPSEIMLRTRKSSPIPPVTLTAVSIPHSAKLNKAETADKRIPIKKYFNASPPFILYTPAEQLCFNYNKIDMPKTNTGGGSFEK